MPVLDLGNGFLNVDGNIVEKDVYNIAQRIKHYDENLEILYLDPDRYDRTVNDAPYIIAERCKDGNLRRVFEVWTLDESVLERIESADTQRHDLMAIMDGRLVEFKNEREQRYKEKTLEAKDVFAHLLKNPSTTYTFPNAAGEIVTMDDKFGVTKRDGKSVERS